MHAVWRDIGWMPKSKPMIGFDAWVSRFF
ncbi:hypothetical protein XOCgx_3949 [Xanthomonas oryzae pv. oryzicola]|nr:hypothetical protein XOCgx_3949 [Xanthomonas oryzae pv. oryzicola]